MSAPTIAIPKFKSDGSKAKHFRTRETLIGLLFILPSLIGFTLFYAVPTVRGLVISFSDWDLLTPARSVGLDNYARLLKDPTF